MTMEVKLNMSNFGMVEFCKSELEKEHQSNEKLNEQYKEEIVLMQEFLSVEKQKAEALRDIGDALTSICKSLTEFLN